MKEKIIKFIVVALVAFFSASMACADNAQQQAKYPYVYEKIEIGYPLDEFTLDSIAKKQTIKYKVKPKQEKEEEFDYTKDILLAIVFLFFFFLLSVGGVGVILSIIGLGALLVTQLFHKRC